MSVDGYHIRTGLEALAAALKEIALEMAKRRLLDEREARAKAHLPRAAKRDLEGIP